MNAAPVAAVLSAAVIASTPAWQAPGVASDVEPIVAVRYRGSPAGQPVQDDLALIRALGFSAIVWAYDDPVRDGELDRLARLIGLVVVPAGGRLDLGAPVVIDVQKIDPRLLPALAWLAITDRHHLVVVDAGRPTGAGLYDDAGGFAAWVKPAVAVGRQVEANSALIGRLRAGPSVTPPPGEPPSPARVILSDGGRAWVLIAANPTSTAALALVHLPRSIPYGPWVSLVDGHDMSMLVRRDVHEYRALLAPGEARVYVIDKTPERQPLF